MFCPSEKNNPYLLVCKRDREAYPSVPLFFWVTLEPAKIFSFGSYKMGLFFLKPLFRRQKRAGWEGFRRLKWALCYNTRDGFGGEKEN
jgi:hypothetical protein